MARAYKQNRRSVKAKTYEDYLNMRTEELTKGYLLKSPLTRTQFETLYETVRAARNSGELKTSAWDWIKKHQRFVVSGKQAKNLQKAYKDVYGRGIKLGDVYRLSADEVNILFAHIAETKESGLYGGNYE